MISKEELIHHILPATAGSSVMLSLGEHFLFSVAVGVSIWVITHGLSSLAKKVFK